MQHILNFVDALWPRQSQALKLRKQKTVHRYYNSARRFWRRQF